MLQITVSNSKGTGTYTIRQSEKDGAIICSCPAWTFMKGKPGNARACKHILSLSATLGMHVEASS